MSPQFSARILSR